MLSPYRVLDLTNERGLLCGQMLGDLGADVIIVEPPGGSSARQIGPFYQDDPHPDRSLYWWAYNRNKRAITLDLDTNEGQAILRRLVASAHFLIESDRPGTLAERGLAYDDLAAPNPGLVYVSITPFGQEGPKAGYLDSDLIVWAAGGALAITGDEDRPPVRCSVPQSYLHAGAEGAVAALIAHHHRERTGEGQHVDISAQQAASQATFGTALSASLDWPATKRLSGGFRYGPFVIPGVYPAQDGYVAILMLFGSAIGPMTRRLMEYVCELGFCDKATRDKDWIGYTELLFTGKEPVEELQRVQQVVAEFTKSKTKAALLKDALERGLLIGPVTTIDEAMASEQFAARDYWQELQHPELGRAVRYPGPFAKFSATPISYRHRPPTVGEHNRDVYIDELGFSEQELAALVDKGVV